MNTEIIYRGSFHHKVNPDNPPKETRELDSFLYFNGAVKCFLKGQGGWYKLMKNGGLYFVTKRLSDLPLKEWLKVALDDTFTPNIK